MRISLLSWFFFMPICSLFLNFGIFVVSQSQSCLSDQRDLLIGLKKSLIFNRTLSTKLLHWNKTQFPNCCLWKGVYCSKEGRVVDLDLFNESITGGLDNSSPLFGLHYLQTLNLSFNKLNSSQIPSQFGNLTNLFYLNLSNSGFAGQIPSEISNLKRLVTLDLSTYLLLSYSMLEIKKPNLATLIKNFGELKELYLDGVNISAPGNEWCQALSSSVPNLRVLSMSDCYLSGPFDFSLQKLQSLSIILLNSNLFNAPVPDFFANFANLTSLGLSACGLNGTFPEKVFRILTLQTIDLSNNELLQGSLPEFLPNGSLQSLLLSGTIFSGALPDSIGNLAMLSRIDLSRCNFNGSIPNSMGNLTQLVYLDMSVNNFTGPIPSFSMAKNLTEINLLHNDLTGKIHSLIWKDLLKLVTLDLGYNSLEGTIPDSLFSLPSLQLLQLSNNQFSGRLEFNVSSTLLNTLDLSSNNLEGPVPTSVFQLKGLKVLSLSSNNFSGPFQLNKFQQSRNLSNLDLSYNSLSIEYIETNSSSSSFPQITTLRLASCNLKTFPYFLTNQSTLNFLDLSQNQIHGEIPNWIWKFYDLIYLDLSYNHLTMTPEVALFNLSGISVLDLHSNQLEGELPDLPPSATYLDFSMNNFNSAIPASIGDSLYSAYIFSLSSNKFHGGIPQSLCTATYLQVLDLSNNTLDGMIPQCLIEMSENFEFGVLDVRRNKLSGTISDTFSGNCSLQTLNLNKNLLEGAVPRSLGNCKSLEVFDIGNNYIEDTLPCHLRSISRLRVLVLRSNKFYGSIHCEGSNAPWPMLQILDLASNHFIGPLPRKSLSAWKAMTNNEDVAQSELKHLGFLGIAQYLYLDVTTVTMKGQVMELPKILTFFTSFDLSCNYLDGPIPDNIGILNSLYILNLSHNAFVGQIPPSLGKLSHLESLDLSSNQLSGEIPVQLADGLTFLSVLNLSLNQLFGPIPCVKQFGTFLEDSYERNKGLCGCVLKTKCESAEPSLPPSEDIHLKSRPLINWNYLIAELGFFSGFGMVIGPLIFWKRWRILYYKHVDDIFFRIYLQLHLGGQLYHRMLAHRNVGRRY
ncbi:hypothetical protein ACB092_07G019400 [Castanea dentata]